MSVFTTRGATENDIPAMLSIANACFSDPWSESAFVSTLSHATLIELDGKALGYSVLAQLADEAELYDIAVLPEYQGTGAAKQLFDYALSRLTGEVSTLYLEVRESNTRARGFYAKLGFEQIGVRKNYYDNPKENAILMSLDLKRNERQK